jgi:hypothetical protein
MKRAAFATGSGIGSTEDKRTPGAFGANKQPPRRDGEDLWRNARSGRAWTGAGLLAADGQVHPAGASNGGNRHLESLRV